ncbi:MAG: AraC family ligand binding domain-containing protein [Treponema sp.]|jgi:mannose-6-phosphate isomerase-like protein (cupin superfamily)|nr:AraC family ligand binding domain-containing protein [Treponema sp.]
MDEQYALIYFDSSIPMGLTCQNIRRMNVHWNNEIELIIVLNGSLTVSCNNRLITLNEDDVLAVNENILHGI